MIYNPENVVSAVFIEAVANSVAVRDNINRAASMLLWLVDSSSPTIANSAPMANAALAANLLQHDPSRVWLPQFAKYCHFWFSLSVVLRISVILREALKRVRVPPRTKTSTRSALPAKCISTG